MPYISNELRVQIDDEIDSLVDQALHLEMVGPGPVIDGLANYIITRITCGLFKEEERWRYHSLAHAVGCLESVKAELQRRVVAPYEDLASQKNGDIEEYYEFDKNVQNGKYS